MIQASFSSYQRLVCLLLASALAMPCARAQDASETITGQILGINAVDGGRTQIILHQKSGDTEVFLSDKTLIRGTISVSQVQAGDEILLDAAKTLEALQNSFVDMMSPESQKAAAAAPPMPPQGMTPPQGPPPPPQQGDPGQPPQPPRIPPPPKGPPDNQLPNEKSPPPVSPEAQAATQDMQQQAQAMMQQQQGEGQGEEAQKKKEKPWEKEVQDPHSYKDTLNLDEPPLKPLEEEKKEEAPAGEGAPGAETAAPEGPQKMKVLSITKTEETVTLELEDPSGVKHSASMATEEPVMLLLKPEDLSQTMLIQVAMGPEKGDALAVTVLSLGQEAASPAAEAPAPETTPQAPAEPSEKPAAV